MRESHVATCLSCNCFGIHGSGGVGMGVKGKEGDTNGRKKAVENKDERERQEKRGRVSELCNCFGLEDCGR